MPPLLSTVSTRAAFANMRADRGRNIFGGRASAPERPGDPAAQARRWQAVRVFASVTSLLGLGVGIREDSIAGPGWRSTPLSAASVRASAMSRSASCEATNTLSKASLAPLGIDAVRSTRLTMMPRPAPSPSSSSETMIDRVHQIGA